MNAQAFLLLAQTDPALQTILAEMGGDLPMILGIARELGFAVTAGELVQAKERLRRQDKAQAEAGS